MRFLTTLFDHQKKAVEKLKKLRVGALYMEMGTGKTRTALELSNLRLMAGKIEHVLWLCPCSCKKNLERDIIFHAGRMWENLTICGIETLSQSTRENARLIELVKEKSCELVVDESNLIKNHRALRSQNILRLAEYASYRLILNGTPISRNEADLYTQWFVLDWRILGYRSYWSFAANHIEYDSRIPGKIQRCLNIDYIAEKIAPYSYQIKKSECLDLPPKTYKTQSFELTEAQYNHYIATADALLFSVDETKPYTLYRLFTALQNVTSGLYVDTSEPHLKSSPFFEDPLDNPRIKALVYLLERNEEKTIIYCKYTFEIKLIVGIINKMFGEGAAVPFFGEVSLKNRDENFIRFQNEAQFFVANKACAGYGLNQQFCAYIIFYNNDWDFATRIQSEDRVHRIGQKNNVHIVDICAEDTLDERVLNCLTRKENLLESFKEELGKLKDCLDSGTWKDAGGHEVKNVRRSELLDA